MSSSRNFNSNYLFNKVKTLFKEAISKKRLGKVQKETINNNFNTINNFIAKYKKGDITNISTVEKIIDKVDNLMKIKKVIFNKINKINNDIEIRLEKIRLEKIRLENIRLDKIRLEQDKIKLQNNFVNQRIIRLDFNKLIIDEYGFITNKIEFNRLRASSPNCYYVQDVKFYDINNNLINSGVFKNLVFDYHFISTQQFNNFIKTVDLKMSMNGSDSDYKPKKLLFSPEYEGGDNAYTIITTTAYKLITKNLNIDLEQVYKDSDTGHCVYDAFLNYFSTKKDTNRNAKAIYNKLISEKGEELKKSYTDNNINEIALFCNSTLKIRDIINGTDKDFKNEYSRFYVELLNTKYNHLDLLQHTYNQIEEIEAEKLFEIKKQSSFYIEKNGLLITLDKTYKTKSTEFNDVFTAWKNEYNFNELFILQNSDEFTMINQYDNNLHTFFNNFEIKNDLYTEIDLKKAYFNYSNVSYNSHYRGVPSGSFINIKCDESFKIETFEELYKNDLIGYFQVKILSHITHKKHFDILGLVINSYHVLTSAQINLLKQYVQFQFLNASYAPTVHIPFNEKFLNKDENGLKHYCKAYGLMLQTNSAIDITIKPLSKDKNYYKTIDNDIYDIYQVDDLFKISYKNKDYKSHAHIANYIHSYTRTLIIEQLLNMDINDVFGVKLDSIVVKNSSLFLFLKLNYDDINFDLKEANIESMLNYDKSLIALSNVDNYRCSHFKPYFTQCDEERINFNQTILYDGSIIKKRIVFIGGAGGSGKTSSLLRGLPNKNICYTTSCWNLIQGQKKKYPEIMGFSIPNLIGECAGLKTEKIKNNNIKYLIIDELTLIDENNIKKIMDIYKNCYIFLLGDIDIDGFFYQCTLPTIKLFKPDDNVQYIKYTKNYRFNEELSNKLNQVRNYMKINFSEPDKTIKLYNLKKYVAQQFKFFNKEDIIFENNDIGISAINDYQNNENELTNYFIKKGTTPQYFIKTTNKNLGLLKGQQLDTKPSHKNFECKLFKTIHSFQGLDLQDDNKIIISITKNFDYNLFYTAISRAKRIDQIILLN